MTYAEAAKALGVGVQAVQKRARRNNWSKRIDNESGKAKVLIDPEALGVRAGTTSSHVPAKESSVLVQSEEDQQRLRELELGNATLTAKLAATEGMVTELRGRIEELREDQKESREVIAGLLRLLDAEREPPRSWLSSIFGGRGR
jgi:hypothetical protein